MKKSILIVEDEAVISYDLSMILKKLGYQVAGVAVSFEQAIAIIASKRIDLVLLDVVLKGERSGIDVAKALNDTNEIPFIFITSLYDKKTVESVQETDPAGYIVKPFKEIDLGVTISLAWRKQKFNNQTLDSTFEKKLFVREKGIITPISPDDIYYIKADNNYATIYTAAAKYVTPKTLKKVEEQLNNVSFCRIHKTYLINLSKIDLIEQSVVFIKGDALPIGYAYRKDLFERITVF